MDELAYAMSDQTVKNNWDNEGLWDADSELVILFSSYMMGWHKVTNELILDNLYCLGLLLCDGTNE